MKTIQNYAPPDAQSLQRLQDRLGFSDARMAELAGLDAATPWSSFVGGPEPRTLGRQRLFFMMARLSLDEAQWQRVLDAMHDAGARFDYDEALSASTPPAPEPVPDEERKFGMLLVSRNGAFHEMEQLREFAHFAHEADVSRYVNSVFYDSDIDLCRFRFADHDGLTDASRDRIFDAAHKTITRFEFDGRIYHGGIPPESDG
ncbi:MAG: hypothetical protein QHC88_16470 [Achromobacter sp.]|uniref:hypothetical protein n=1 Tax=unclassified Achromobacter TaxID=2626865 RepID=UPI000E755A4A|nr:MULTISPECIES: hypothetical protein [unclassified Achromobacter]AYD63759.1 hypothetical protein DVB37_07345 [Achromobacter sp. B7]MDX3986844.1 hypothetical protein [Achromobacter sp.]